MNIIDELLDFLNNNCYRYEDCKQCLKCKFKEYLELKKDKNRECD